MANLLYGMHDPGNYKHILPKGGWVVFTEGIGHDPNDQSGKDFRSWTDDGYNVLVRLNNGYGSEGTLPTGDQYDNFARRCANYVRNSPGATRWIIGNESNHAQEWPQGQVITSREYARAFLLARTAIKSVGNQHQVLVAGVAPWNVQAGDWLKYQYDMLERIGRNADGITLHTYTHGTDPALIASEDKMNAPYQNRHYHFRAYRDMLEQVPTACQHLPVYITETDQDVPWADTNSGWVQRAYAEIQVWNQTQNTQKIQCLVLYRWPDYDQWGIINKQGVQNDLKDATLAMYKSPAVGVAPPTAPPPTQPSLPPTTPPPSQPAPTLPPISWDPMLTQRGVAVENPKVSPGGTYWRLINADYRTAEEFGGRHHIYVDVVDENGVRLIGQKVEIHNGGTAVLTTEAKPGEEASANFPMYASGHAYDASVVGLPSDKVTGMGLGTVENPNVGHHVSYFLVWQRSKAAETVVKPPVTPPTQPPPVVQPPVVPPTQPPPIDSGDECWERVLKFILDHEGGWADNVNDPGGKTMRGITIGTYTAWRKAQGKPAPTADELRNISDQEVEQIYKEWYWKASGADKMECGLALLHMNLAVNAGPGRANEMLQKSGGNLLSYLGHQMQWYGRIDGWKHFSKAWNNRNADLLHELAKMGYLPSTEPLG